MNVIALWRTSGYVDDDGLDGGEVRGGTKRNKSRGSCDNLPNFFVRSPNRFCPHCFRYSCFRSHAISLPTAMN